MISSWRGTLHLKMHWWHTAHFPVWRGPELPARSVDWHREILARARATVEDLPAHLPANGGLLIATALMAAGWDGSADAPGFPDGFVVRHEGIAPLPG